MTSNAQLTPLSSDENNLFSTSIVAGVNGPIYSLQYVSPDGRYVVYAGGIPDESAGFSQYSIRLGNRQTRQSIDTAIRTVNPFDPVFDVVWNSNSSAFSVRIDKPNSFAWLGGYVTNFQANPANLRLTQFTDFNLNNTPYEIYNRENNLAVYGIATDQPLILTEMTKTPQVYTDNPEIRLALVNMDNPAQTQLFSQLDASHIPAASFSASSENVLWVITPQGLITFDVKSGKEAVVDPVVNSAWAYVAAFSPDRTMLAVIHVRDDGQREVYVGKLPLVN